MASKRLDLPPIAHFDHVSDPASIGQRWKAWKFRFTTSICYGYHRRHSKKSTSFISGRTGDARHCETLPDKVDAKDFAKAMEKWDAYFSPKGNADYEIFKFRTAIQSLEEAVDQFVTRLR